MPDKIPDFGQQSKSLSGQLNILIAGKHGGLVDTMIFANIDPKKGKITLISVPRDLYYNGRKINSIYSSYGMEELKRSLSFVTGYKVDKYILIDMYAFIDVIDLIGGIDVHLKNPVIDPTYKTCDAGECTTLYYRAGDHHVSGTQALRLARSRHTSSDFARSERQQLIVAALKKKAQNFGFGDANNLRKVAQSIFSKVETDMSIAEAISSYFRYQNLEIKGGNVLSTANVLQSKYTGDLQSTESQCEAPHATSGPPESQEKQTCKKDRGAYILLPQGGNWNTIRWYFNELIEGKKQ